MPSRWNLHSFLICLRSRLRLLILSNFFSDNYFLATCPAPTVPEFAVLPVQANYVFGDVFTIQCQEGYILTGTSQIACGLDEVFETSDAVCSPGISYWHLLLAFWPLFGSSMPGTNIWSRQRTSWERNLSLQWKSGVQMQRRVHISWGCWGNLSVWWNIQSYSVYLRFRSVICNLILFM